MYSKEQQLYKNKKPKITQHEKDYLAWLQTQKFHCFVCHATTNIEMHHVKFKSTDKKNHKRLIPLCKFHHTGNIFSVHGTPTQWREAYTLEEQNNYADKIYAKYINP